MSPSVWMREEDVKPGALIMASGGKLALVLGPATFTDMLTDEPSDFSNPDFVKVIDIDGEIYLQNRRYTREWKNETHKY